MGLVGYKHNANAKKKMKEYWTTEKRKEESKKILGDKNPMKRDGVLEKQKKGLKVWRSKPITKELYKNLLVGRKHTLETKKKIGKGNKGKLRGEKSHFWKGGVSFESYSFEWIETLKRAIRERDHYTCQMCYKEGLCVHHIDYNKKNCNLNNLITLCNKCHIQTNFKREYWINKFQTLMKK
jgi:hypothetical protein